MSVVSSRHSKAKALHHRIQGDLEALETIDGKRDSKTFVDSVKANIDELEQLLKELKSLTAHDSDCWQA